MPRLNKRAQREQDALAALQQGVPKGLSESDDEKSEPEIRSKLGFVSLQVSEPESEHSDADAPVLAGKQSKTKKKKKKKTKTIQDPSASSIPASPSRPPAKKEKSKAKKLDDIDLALQELALTERPDTGASEKSVTASSSALQKLRELLSTSPKHLDGDAELRRFFGSKVVNSAKQHSKQRRINVRSQLTNPPATWPMVRLSQGLSMRPLEDSEIWRKVGAYPGDKWWTVEHSVSYKSTELSFLETVQLGHYQGFMEILSRHPWHIDSLLQMSEVARHQEDNTQGSDLVARSLFSFERAFTPSFNITTGVQRLDFDRIENRPFFLALARYVVNLQKRGTNRTAFEFARLLLSLDPGGDPHGSLLYLDYLAVRSGMSEWLISMWDVWQALYNEDPKSFTGSRADIGILPGWRWARALALRTIEEQSGDTVHERSKEVLRDAVFTFPHVLPVLADRAGITLAADVRANASFRISTGWDYSAKGESTIHLLSHLYAQRASELWKVPEVAEWLRSTIDGALLKRLASETSPARIRARNAFENGTPESIVRHVIVAENRAVMTFFSPNAVPRTMVSYDPVPPRTSLSQYDEAYFQGVAIGKGRRRDPGVHGRPALGDEEELIQVQEMIMQEIQRRQRAAGDVPGAFPGAEHDPEPPVHEGEVDSEIEASEDEEDEDDDQDLPAATGGFMQGLYNLLWRRTPTGNDGRGGND